MTDIKPIHEDNLNVYCSQMARGAEDKAWALRLYPSSIVVDIGCADGHTLKWAKRYLHPNMIGIGYDNDKRMVERARLLCTCGLYFTSDLQKMKSLVERMAFYHSMPVIVLLNSVLHEVYNYSEPSQIYDLWAAIQDMHPTAIAIRDMGIPFSKEYVTNAVRPYYQQLKQRWPQLVEQHDKYWGQPNSWSELHRLALHLFYREDWEQEWKEDYFSCSPDIPRSFLSSRYKVTRFERFSTAHYCDWVQKEFATAGNAQHWPMHCTHYRMLMTLKEQYE